MSGTLSALAYKPTDGYNGPGRAFRPNRFIPWYDHIIDYLFANPNATNADIALYTKRNQQYIGIVRNSDAFKMRYAQRRDEMNARLEDAIGARLDKVAVVALDALLERVEEKKDALSVAELTDLNDKILGRLGYGTKPQAAALNVNVNATAGASSVSVTASPEELSAAREALRAVERAHANGVLPPQIEGSLAEAPVSSPPQLASSEGSPPASDELAAFAVD